MDLYNNKKLNQPFKLPGLFVPENLLTKNPYIWTLVGKKNIFQAEHASLWWMIIHHDLTGESM